MIRFERVPETVSHYTHHQFIFIQSDLIPIRIEHVLITGDFYGNQKVTFTGRCCFEKRFLKSIDPSTTPRDPFL
jgi:hypothetical protein